MVYAIISLVILESLLIAWAPILWMSPLVSLLLFVTGIALAIIGLVTSIKSIRNKAQRGQGIAGTILSVVALVVVAFMLFFFLLIVIGGLAIMD
ncbi:MAG: hypothetical protein MJ238_05285 [Bacilli bacterium]|nr:hypothetical protein [Bacilli bacterium]